MPSPVVFRAVDVPAADGTADSYLLHPDDGTAHPGVLFFMDIFGLRPLLREMMEPIAAQGFTVLAPNLFYRSGRAPVLPPPDPTDPQGRMTYFHASQPMLRELAGDSAIEDVRGYLDWLTTAAPTAAGPIAITGYCMGGRLALRAAGAFGDRLRAVASFHGGYLAVDEDKNSPHHTASSITAEVFLAHADNDPTIPPEQIARLEKSLATAGVRHTSVVYPNTRHAFTMRDSTAFTEAAYERHLRDLLALLHR
ncbi:dienelactone hydrolase family protein [Nocardia sp. NPDC052566]|uniref:dienelactone hydrolase family protein n=1 Tax=Nocardia sp. NPDC052566 TaxID=3364330 RepID=UPI0037C526B8